MRCECHACGVSALCTVYLWKVLVDLKWTVELHQITADTQESMFTGSLSLEPYSVWLISLSTWTAVGCIIMKRSFPASDSVNPVTISHIGPLYSLGPQSESSFSGEAVIHASRAPHALVVPLDIGKFSSVSPIRPASRILSILV